MTPEVTYPKAAPQENDMIHVTLPPSYRTAMVVNGTPVDEGNEAALTNAIEAMLAGVESVQKIIDAQASVLLRGDLQGVEQSFILTDARLELLKASWQLVLFTWTKRHSDQTKVDQWMKRLL